MGRGSNTDSVTFEWGGGATLIVLHLNGGGATLIVLHLIGEGDPHYKFDLHCIL